jgi:hypothetical protein
MDVRREERSCSGHQWIRVRPQAVIGQIEIRSAPVSAATEVLSFRKHREALGSETPRVHRAHRLRRGPLAARAQHSAMPVVGFLNPQLPDGYRLRAFHQGLKDAGFVEGENVAICWKRSGMWTRSGRAARCRTSNPR